jgi:hypothetical protein
LNPFLLIIITSLKNACYLWIEGVAKVSKKWSIAYDAISSLPLCTPCRKPYCFTGCVAVLYSLIWMSSFYLPILLSAYSDIYFICPSSTHTLPLPLPKSAQLKSILSWEKHCWPPEIDITPPGEPDPSLARASGEPGGLHQIDLTL